MRSKNIVREHNEPLILMCSIFHLTNIYHESVPSRCSNNGCQKSFKMKQELFKNKLHAYTKPKSI